MSKLKKYQKIANERGGYLLSTSISGRKLQWQCSEGHIFLLTTYKVNRRGQWCKKCGSSKGERAIRCVLTQLNVYFEAQYRISLCPRRRYDFYFEFNNRRFVVEFDGEQHFVFTRRYHKTKAKFIKSQIVDRIKTYYAWNSGIVIIRIDFTQIDNIYDHIMNGINSGALVYLSDAQLYKYITDIDITQKQFEQYS